MLNRRRFLCTAAPAALLAQTTKRPNVVLFLADDLGYGDVASGAHNTPHIDSIFRDGVRLTQTYAFPYCSPSRSALMTGRNPVRYGMVYTVIRPWTPHGLPLDEYILPQALKASGYQTAILGKWHLGHAHKAHSPLTRGFDHFYGFVNADVDYFEHTHAGGLDWQRNGRGVREKGYATDLLADEALRWIGARDRSRPFFLYLPFGAMHSPMQASEPYLQRHASITDRTKRLYAAMLSAMDDAVGRVLKKLDDDQVTRDTLVIFASDNGGVPRAGGSNAPFRAAKGTVFEGGIRVPAAVRWPGVLKPGSNDQRSSLMDLFPTIAEVTGSKAGGGKPLDGESVWECWKTGSTRPRGPMFFGVKKNETDEKQHALRDGDWKLVQDCANAQCRPPHLFNIAADPQEKTDLAPRHPDKVAELQKSLDEWVKLYPPGDILSSMRPHPGWVPPRDFAEAAWDYPASSSPR